jgi:16S rRNA C967 or C1407 C5-methylase (RsmB/RsmF family)
VYNLNTNKQIFKKSKILSEFHKYLQKSFDSGLISRQELVSMLPPLYLNIQPDDIVLDLCAAPGSKTSQILEMIYGKRRWLAKGCVVANDADYSRAQMLIHQLHRSGTTGMAVINHPGQFLPELYTNKVGSVKHKFQFDKILCDVPCSGDGATRKLPIKWVNWHSSDGMVLHPLQLSILMKAINVLKKGGYLVYSTCSLNPI